jgi:hypothetical protein
MGHIFNNYLNLIVLTLLTHRFSTEEDCIAGEWAEWSSCGDTGINFLEAKGIGKLSRVRSKLSGNHCEDQDLTETKLCVLNESSSPDTRSGEGDNEIDGEGEVKTGEGTVGHSASDQSKETELVKHIATDRKERTVLITLLSVAAVLLTAGGVVGAVLIRQHKTLQRRHKILVMTKERIRLIDGEKLEVRKSGSMLCGLGPQITVHNPSYESEGEESEWTRASTFPTGQLRLQSD